MRGRCSTGDSHGGRLQVFQTGNELVTMSTRKKYGTDTRQVNLRLPIDVVAFAKYISDDSTAVGLVNICRQDPRYQQFAAVGGWACFSPSAIPLNKIIDGDGRLAGVPNVRSASVFTGETPDIDGEVDVTVQPVAQVQKVASVVQKPVKPAVKESNAGRKITNEQFRIRTNEDGTTDQFENIFYNSDLDKYGNPIVEKPEKDLANPVVETTTPAIGKPVSEPAKLKPKRRKLKVADSWMSMQEALEEMYAGECLFSVPCPSPIPNRGSSPTGRRGRD